MHLMIIGYMYPAENYLLIYKKVYIYNYCYIVIALYIDGADMHMQATVTF